MGLLSGRLGLKKLAFLQEHDDRFSTSGANMHCEEELFGPSRAKPERIASFKYSAPACFGYRRRSYFSTPKPRYG